MSDLSAVSPPQISIVVPAYNEEKNIPLIYQRISDVLGSSSYQWELVFVDDCSADGTLEAINELASVAENVRFVSFTRNFGHQAALTAGMDIARGEAIITMDCDLQDPPELLPEMIDKWEQGSLIVYAKRQKRNDKFFKLYTARMYYWMLNRACGFELPRNVGDFRLVDRSVLNTLGGMREKDRYLRGMVAWTGYPHDFVYFERPERIHGETNYTLRKMFKLGMDGLLSFSMIPLRFGLGIGVLSIFLGLAFLMYMGIDTVVNDVYYPLYKILVVVLFIFTGMLFCFLWMMGEYIGRIYNECRDRPLYVARDIAGSDTVRDLERESQ